MQVLKNILSDAEQRKIAIGHFNIGDLAQLKAIAEAAAELKVPVIIGTSEGEREFIDAHEAAAMVNALRKEHKQPIFLNADHTHTIAKCREAIDAGYDAILFDPQGGIKDKTKRLSLDEQIKQTQEVVAYARTKNPEILIEGELGYIGSSSRILKEIPEGAEIKLEDLTKPAEAARFIKESGADMLAPAVGNIHGMFANAPNPHLNIERISEIKEALRQAMGKGVPLVLHGGSGIEDEDFFKAIAAGITIIHISTELRLAWRKGVEQGLKEKPDEIAPYKVMAPAVDEMKKIVYNRLKLFNRL